MTIKVVDPIKAANRVHGAGKQVLHDSANYHAWIHGPDAPGDKGPMHKHTADQTFICLKGVATYNFPDGSSAKLTPGMMIIIPKGDFYQIENAGTEDMILVGSRAEPYAKPRFTTDEEVVDTKTRFNAGANY